MRRPLLRLWEKFFAGATFEFKEDKRLGAVPA